MLPFLKPRKLADVIMAKHSVQGETKQELDVTEEQIKMAEELLGAFASKDAPRVARALQSISNPNVNTLKKGETEGA